MAVADFNAMIKTDFERIISDIGVTVSLYRFTQNQSNITGDENIDNYSSAVSIKGVFELNQRDFKLDREGIMEQGDASFYSRASDNVLKDDKISFEGKTYLVEDKTRRNNVDFCRLGLWL